MRVGNKVRGLRGARTAAILSVVVLSFSASRLLSSASGKQGGHQTNKDNDHQSCYLELINVNCSKIDGVNAYIAFMCLFEISVGVVDETAMSVLGGASHSGEA